MESAILDTVPADDPTEPSGALAALVLPAMFWRPVHLAASAWLEHVPFAFWLTAAHRPRVFVELGTHYGVSYFAFCQAVDRLGLATKCFAIDSWKGDAHAGFYENDVYESVQAHNDALYSGFSRLVRSSFDAAVGHFADGAIDLLHIDGLHTYEAVAHDFETWSPKLSEDAIVLFHDTNVRERDFGVHRLFEQLAREHAHFEFTHGHGLGLLAKGRGRGRPVRALLEAQRHPAARQAVREMFGRLGRGIADRAAQETAAPVLRAELAAARKAAESHAERSRALEARLAEAERSAQAQVAALEARRAAAERRAQALAAGIAAAAREREALLVSSSWRLTAPLRRLGDVLRRRSAEEFDPAFYLASNPDVAASGMDPEEHYRRYGKAEGRPPRRSAASKLGRHASC